MANQHDYIFFIQNKDNLFWQPGPSGLITINANPYPLQFSPDGWLDIEVDNARNMTYWGLERSVTESLKYVEDGAAIIKHIIYTRGFNEEVYLTVCRQVVEYAGTDYAVYYKTLLRQQINLTTFNHSGAVVTAATLEANFVKYLKANENTKYSIAANVAEAIRVKMDGLTLTSIKDFISVNETASVNINGIGNATRTRYFPITYSHVQVDGTNVNLIAQDISMSELVGIDYSTSDQWFLEASAATTLNVKVKWGFNFQAFVGAPGTSAQATVSIIRNDGGTVRNFYNLNTSGPVNVFPTVDDTFTATMAPGERWFMMLIMVIRKNGADNSSYSSNFKIFENTHEYTYNNRYKTTYIYALRGQYLLEQLVNKMTEGRYKAAPCPYLAAQADKIFFSGDCLRSAKDPALQISLSDLFKFYNGFDDVGIIEATSGILLDRKANLVTGGTIALGDVANPRISIYNDLLFNELAIGYPDQREEVGILNSRNEFNTTLNFSIGNATTSKKLDKVSPIQASCFAQEKARINGITSGSTAIESDNALYVAHIEDNVTAGNGTDIPDHYQLDRTLNAFSTGIEDYVKDSVWNIELSPKRNLLRNGGFIRSCQYKSDTLNLKFLTGDRNTKLQTVVSGAAVTESADENIGALDAPYFFPVQIEFEVPVMDSLIDILDAQPIQEVLFSIDGYDYRGIPLKLSISPASGSAQTITVLSAASNDLSKLVQYYGG